MNFREIFNSGRGYKFQNHDGTFGLEIETETDSLASYPTHFFHLSGENESGLPKYDLDSVYWYAVEDHSLRNYGMEFPLIVPLPYMRLLDALDEFRQMTSKVKFIDSPPGASVHVHVNMLNEKLITLANFITLWVQFETPLIEFCGVPRRSNLFALPVRAAEKGLDHYCLLFKLLSEKNDMAISNFNEKSCKYSALNIAPLSRLGTVEIRPMRGTTDVEIIKTWVGIINNMLRFARTPGLTPYYILQETRDNLDELVHKVFGEHTKIVTNPYWKSQVERNLHYVYTLVDSVLDWDNFADYSPVKEIEKTKPKKAKITSNTIEYLDQLNVSPTPAAAPQGPQFGQPNQVYFNPWQNLTPTTPVNIDPNESAEIPVDWDIDITDDEEDAA